MIELFGEPVALPLLWWLGLPLAGACVGFGAGLALRKDRPDPRDREEASVSKPAAVAAYGEGLDALTPIGGVEDVARIAAIQDEPLRTRATLEMARRLRDQVKAGGQAGPLADLHGVNGDDPYNPPRDESRVTKRRDDDDEPPVSGLTVTAVQPRYDWAHLRGEVLPAPGPWRAPLRSPFHRTVAACLQAPIRIRRLRPQAKPVPRPAQVGRHRAGFALGARSQRQVTA